MKNTADHNCLTNYVFNRNVKQYIQFGVTLLLLQNQTKLTEQPKVERFPSAHGFWLTVSRSQSTTVGGGMVEHPICSKVGSTEWRPFTLSWAGSRERTWENQGLQKLVPHPRTFPQPPKIVPQAGNKLFKIRAHRGRDQVQTTAVLGGTRCFLFCTECTHWNLNLRPGCAIRWVRMCRGTRKASAQVPRLAPALSSSSHPRQGESYFDSRKGSATLKFRLPLETISTG